MRNSSECTTLVRCHTTIRHCTTQNSGAYSDPPPPPLRWGWRVCHPRIVWQEGEPLSRQTFEQSLEECREEINVPVATSEAWALFKNDMQPIKRQSKSAIDRLNLMNVYRKGEEALVRPEPLAVSINTDFHKTFEELLFFCGIVTHLGT